MTAPSSCSELANLIPADEQLFGLGVRLSHVVGNEEVYEDKAHRSAPAEEEAAREELDARFLASWTVAVLIFTILSWMER